MTHKSTGGRLVGSSLGILLLAQLNTKGKLFPVFPPMELNCFKWFFTKKAPRTFNKILFNNRRKMHIV